MNKIDLTEYSDRELSLMVFNTYELYQHVEAFCKLVQQSDDPTASDVPDNELVSFAGALSDYKVTRAQWKVLYEDIRQYYRENYAGSISR